MFDKNIIARTHFTTKADGQAAYYAFLKEMGIDKDQYPFEYVKGKDGRGKRCNWRAVSWGGYVNADRRWVLFVSWRCTSHDYIIALHWDWDSENMCAFNGRELRLDK